MRQWMPIHRQVWRKGGAMQSMPPKIRLTDADREVPKYVAYRCHSCRKDFDTSLNVTPKRTCRFCGGGLWTKVRVLTLKEAYDLYAQTGVVFLNHDKEEHLTMQKWLKEHSRIVNFLDKKQRAGVLGKFPYKVIRWMLKDI